MDQGTTVMRKFIIEDKHDIAPFNELARELRVLNKPLWLAQHDALAPYCETEVPVASLEEVPADPEAMIVHRDNLFFDEAYIAEFIEKARDTGLACRAAFWPDDKAFVTYALPLSRNILAEPKSWPSRSATSRAGPLKTSGAASRSITMRSTCGISHAATARIARLCRSTSRAGGPRPGITRCRTT
jgi:hypothetical protein